MGKKSPFQLFLRVFIKSVLVMTAVLGVGVGSYQLTMAYYKSSEPKVDEQAQRAVLDLVNDAPVENIEKTLIYHVDSRSGAIRHMVLQIFNVNTYNLDYVTIPVRTQLELSPELYQKLGAVNPEVPQILTLFEMKDYFPEDTIYGYGLVLLKDLLDVDINYYAVLEDEAYNVLFRTEKRDLTYEAAPDGDAGSGETKTMTGSVQVLRKTFLKQLREADSKEKLEQLISERYEGIVSSLSEKNRLKYAGAYFQVKRKRIHYHILYGQLTGGRFHPDASSKELLKELENNPRAYEDPQEKENTGGEAQKTSIGLKIRILNGSGVTGLAAAYRQKLLDDGYTVTGIGNYVSSGEETTRIIVREEGTGEDLLSYFNQAALIVGEVAPENDIEIILGGKDNTE